METGERLTAQPERTAKINRTRYEKITYTKGLCRLNEHDTTNAYEDY